MCDTESIEDRLDTLDDSMADLKAMVGALLRHANIPTDIRCPSCGGRAPLRTVDECNAATEWNHIRGAWWQCLGCTRIMDQDGELPRGE